MYVVAICKYVGAVCIKTYLGVKIWNNQLSVTPETQFAFAIIVLYPARNIYISITA